MRKINDYVESDADYPEYFMDSYGLNYNDGEYYSEPQRIPRVVKLEITTFGVHHFYGQLLIDGVNLRKVKDPSKICYLMNSLTREHPELNCQYNLDVKRPITDEELKTERFDTYDKGDFTVAFNSKEELIKIARRIFDEMFIGNWSFEISDLC
jgi:hypothetical protein